MVRRRCGWDRSWSNVDTSALAGLSGPADTVKTGAAKAGIPLTKQQVPLHLARIHRRVISEPWIAAAERLRG